MIKRILLSIVLVAAMLLPTVALASPTPGGPWGGSWDVQTRTRWGQTGYESELRSPGGSPNINPAGTPVWVVGNQYPFELTYAVATGVTTWNIDFNIDGDFDDPQESVSTTSPTLIGYSFRYLNLWMSGFGTSPNCSAVDVEDFTVNGTNLGNYATICGASPAAEWTWTDTNTHFGNLTITGKYRITGTPGTTQETNRMWIRLGDPVIPADLTVTTTDSLICTGKPTTVTIDLANVANLWGYQFEVSYDQTKASAAGAFVNSFFDTTTNTIVQWAADCTSTPGTCKFAVAKQQTNPPSVNPVSGTGPLAQITLTAIPAATPTTFNMTISNNVLSDIDGIPLAHNVGAPLTINVCGLATVSGFVTLQGRPGNNVDAGTVSMFEQTSPAPLFPAVAPVPFNATTGAYSIQVPYVTGGTSYKIRAEHGLYLGNEEVFTVNGAVANKNTRLWGGDANNSAKIGIEDLSCIGGAFGITPITSTCGGTGSPNINADAVVNIQDLSIAGGNFDKCSYQPWNTALPPNYNCPTPLTGHTVISSPALSFSDGGWGGWSCPPGKVVVGGGFEATAPVAVSAPGTPGSVWPHYTFGPAEYGWVVRDAPDGVPNTITVRPICADPPPGYQVVKSAQLNFSGTGWGGWSCPAGKVVTGGGFENPGAVLAAAPATPGSVWPHYTYNPGEYGWVVQNGGVAGPGFVYSICAAPVANYEVAVSSPLSYGDGGWGGWSCPSNKLITGGGFRATGRVAVSGPATPNSVWPHYTYGPAEYGWVVRDYADGAGSTTTVFSVCAGP